MRWHAERSAPPQIPPQAADCRPSSPYPTLQQPRRGRCSHRPKASLSEGGGCGVSHRRREFPTFPAPTHTFPSRSISPDSGGKCRRSRQKGGRLAASEKVAFAEQMTDEVARGAFRPPKIPRRGDSRIARKIPNTKKGPHGFLRGGRIAIDL